MTEENKIDEPKTPNFSASKLRTLGADTNKFNRIAVGGKSLANDVVITKDWLQSFGRKKTDKKTVIDAIEKGNLAELRRLSNIFYRRSGIYSRLCRYMAYLFRYDWMITPVVSWKNKPQDTKVIEGWLRGCKFLENSKFKKTCGDIALKVMRQGCYYGYRLDQKEASFLQELPVAFCRSRYTLNGWPAIEMNMKYFDEAFSDPDYRLRVVKMYPREIQKAYVDYKKELLKKDFASDDLGWVLLDPEKTVKFNVGNSDVPMFANVIPHLIDLENAQAIDNKKMEQQILKIIVQQFPMGKNDDPIFDVDQMNALHASAVGMLGDAIGVDILSTLADVQVADLSDKGNLSSVDQLTKVERTVYNEAGVSQLQFNSDGSVALEKSIVNDEASLMGLLYQFQEYANRLLAPLNKSPRLQFQVQILPTTSYNYRDLTKLYKEQTTLGYSKLLPQVALGQNPTSVIMNALFENKTMKLDEIFIPPQSSNTMSGNAAKQQESKTQTIDNDGNVADVKKDTTEQGGRPELADDDKSEKTIANRESQQ